MPAHGWFHSNLQGGVLSASSVLIGSLLWRCSPTHEQNTSFASMYLFLTCTVLGWESNHRNATSLGYVNLNILWRSLRATSPVHHSLFPVIYVRAYFPDWQAERAVTVTNKDSSLCQSFEWHRDRQPDMPIHNCLRTSACPLIRSFNSLDTSNCVTVCSSAILWRNHYVVAGSEIELGETGRLRRRSLAGRDEPSNASQSEAMARQRSWRFALSPRRRQ